MHNPHPSGGRQLRALPPAGGMGMYSDALLSPELKA